MNINTIIFDLGGVIINLDELATVSAFAALSGHPYQEVIQLYQQSEVFKQYEMGNISSTVFREEVRKMIDTQSDDATIDRAWNAMLGEIPIQRLELLLDLQKNYRVMILSNTNEIHETAFNQILQQVSGKNSLHDFAHDVFFSHRIHLRKPNADIYLNLLATSGIQAENAIFLDDKLENLEGAKSVGINTLHITTPDDVFKIKSHV
ncbi:HAD family phosphatase [Reichenbachiella agarivorans]|uniref:HAD family phosphatase n=1 Tax=Reichenbachiella agarivorans TaxID=2979464 RepID=A0ABY6CKP3_9BACT|nr:HAD family phosphatase [Reichenbachiella agarivorans]UXP31083.1 HAD family phosphatase [Reichenbachiella agarivorans]